MPTLELVTSTAPSVQVAAQGTLASVLLAQGKPAEAREAAREAMDLLEKLGQIDQGESMVRLADVEARRATGEDREALEALRRAAQRVTERAATIEDGGWRASFLAIAENEETMRLARELGVATE